MNVSQGRQADVGMTLTARWESNTFWTFPQIGYRAIKEHTYTFTFKSTTSVDIGFFPDFRDKDESNNKMSYQTVKIL